MRCVCETRRLGSASEGTAAVPVLDKRLAKNVLPNALHDKSLHFGRVRHPRRRCGGGLERHRREAGGESVGAVEGLIEAAQTDAITAGANACAASHSAISVATPA